ncbi:MAG: alpha-ketoacid dehydrogenase subunit beta, partial [Bacillati bacterium ANGP1]
MSRPVIETTPAPAATRVLTYAEALNEALREEMRRDPRVFVMGE